MSDVPSNSIFATTSLGELLKSEVSIQDTIKLWEEKHRKAESVLRMNRANLAECRLFIRQRFKEHSARLDEIEGSEG